MAKSIMQMDWDTCYLCGRNRIADPCGLEEHHVFGGANRKFSEKYGLKIHICGERCHRNGKDAVHKIKRLIWQSRQQGKRYLNRNVGPMMIS